MFVMWWDVNENCKAILGGQRGNYSFLYEQKGLDNVGDNETKDTTISPDIGEKYPADQ